MISDINLAAAVIIFLISLSPIGEILVAIPTGLALGVNPLLVFSIAYPANLIPAAIILTAMGWLEKRFQRTFAYLGKKGCRFQKYASGRYGFPMVLIFLTPLLGVYATSVTTRLIGFDGKNSFLLQALSLLIYGAVEIVGLNLGLQIFKNFSLS